MAYTNGVPPRATGRFLCLPKEIGKEGNPDGAKAPALRAFAVTVARRRIPAPTADARDPSRAPSRLAGKGLRCSGAPYGARHTLQGLSAKSDLDVLEKSRVTPRGGADVGLGEHALDDREHVGAGFDQGRAIFGCNAADRNDGNSELRSRRTQQLRRRAYRAGLGAGGKKLPKAM